jgi:RNA polymerase sigma-32 factor
VAEAEALLIDRTRLVAALGTLERRERVAVERRHLSEDPATLDKLGKTFAVTRERARQIETRALKKLKHAFFEAA